MFDPSWLVTSGSAAVMVIVSTLLIYAAIVVLSKAAGARSFSQMSSFDFAVTVALGSVIAATVATQDPPALQGIIALAALLGFQALVAALRRWFRWFERAIDHSPLLLMAGTEVIWENMRRGQITQDDLWAQLRQANVVNMDTVRAVVLETTGEINVLHGERGDTKLDPELLSGVVGGERLPEVAKALNERQQRPPYHANWWLTKQSREEEGKSR